MENFFQLMIQLVVPLISTTITIFLGYLLNQYKKKNEERQKEDDIRRAESKAHRDALNKALMTLCRERILQSYKYFKKQGGISVQDLDAITKIYDAYHSLGGNGAISKVYERIRAMAIKEGEFFDG